MNCEGNRKALAAWLETVWDVDAPGKTTVPAEIAEHAQGCIDCGLRLKSALSLINAPQGAPVPMPFLAARIKAELAGTSPGRRKHIMRFPSFTKPVTTSAAAIAIVLISIGLIFGRLWSTEETGTIIMKFSLEAPLATSVHVVGDWNDWDAQANPLFDEDADGIWEGSVKLEPGKEYRYQFYVDDSRWMADPSATLKIDDGFGGHNSILRI